ncbi:hypothetical protein FA13DRAFT_163614 [Coprinellus micaceus]|uniref:Uncharacterized protein n=1 Tax=Coprinellus micaceus TaxID=71717 RepID=A0A4Y7TJB6_COPMI|nr:hypothetical protein FA13DRAFT_163614 [Coprinellus micaceus]
MDKLITPHLTHLALCSITFPDSEVLGEPDNAIMAAERMLRRSRCDLILLRLGVNSPGLQHNTTLGPILSAVGSSLRSLTICIHQLPVSCFTTVANPFLELDSLNLLITERAHTEERTRGIEDFGRWGEAWTATLGASLSKDSLEKRKADGKFVPVSLPEPKLYYFTLQGVSRREVYSRGRVLRKTRLSQNLQHLKEDGWSFDVVFVERCLDSEYNREG